MSNGMRSGLSPTPSETFSLQQKGYSILHKIGQGTYARVHYAEFHDRDGKKIKLACKIFDRNKAPSDFNKKFFPRELEILMRLDNPHIIHVHSIMQRGPKVFIFMRYAENGDLLDYIQSTGFIPEHQSRVWFRQLVSGLEYLHNLDLAHRDLKCENILLSKRFNVKLADFGFARACIDEQGRRILSRTFCGSAAYAPPEIVSGVAYNPKLADIWSLGIVLYIMLNGTMPFDDANLGTLLRNQMMRNWSFRRRVRDRVSPMVLFLIRGMLEPDVTKRFRLKTVAHHEWTTLQQCDTAVK